MILVKYSIMLFSLISFIYFYLTHITEKSKNNKVVTGQVLKSKCDDKTKLCYVQLQYLKKSVDENSDGEKFKTVKIDNLKKKYVTGDNVKLIGKTLEKKDLHICCNNTNLYQILSIVIFITSFLI